MSDSLNDVFTAIERAFEGFAGTGGVAAKNLGGGEEIRVNADGQTATASTIKVPILIELFRQVEQGQVVAARLRRGSPRVVPLRR
jgi:beta-lactamase class A